MIELLPTDFHKILPLVNENEIYGYFSHVRSVLEGRQSGGVHVDDVDHPRTAIVMHCGGPSFVCGDVDNRPFVPDASNGVLTLPHPGFRAFWTPNVAWRESLAEVFDSPRQRTVFDFPAGARPLPSGWRDSLPAGFALKRIDAALAAQVESSFDAWSTNIWGGPTKFVRDTAGFCVMFENQIASACTACYIGGGSAEISIATGQEFRRRGLARLTASALIEWCLTNKLNPNWSCNADNLASAALAESLGFTRNRDIHGFFWSSSTMVWADGKWRNRG